MGRAGAHWIVVAVLGFGLSLVATIAFTQRGIAEAAQHIRRAQADNLRRQLRHTIRIARPSSATLQQFIEDHADSGLRFVAVAGPRRTMRSGTPLGAPQPKPEGPDRLWAIGSRYRFELRTAPPSRLAIAFEFEPQALHALDVAARGALGLGIITAVLSGLLAWAYRRAARARAQLAVELAQERHLASLGEMSAVLAHELKNPLTSLRGHAMLLEEQVEGPARAKVKQVLIDTERLQALTTDLLDFARSGGLQVQPANPAALLRLALNTLQIPQTALDASQAPALWTLDSDRMQQVFENLLANARAQSERVQVRVWSDALQLHIAVRDYGPGLPPGDPEHLFEPFVTHRIKGTGLGLAVARRIVRQHGGTITAVTAPAGGACFEVTLPKTEGSA